MAHASQERYSALVDAKLRATLVTRDNTIFNNRYEGSPKAGKVKIPVRDTEVAVKAYDKANGVDAPYASWLSEVLATLEEHKISQLAIAAPLPTGEVFTGYFGMDTMDKALIATNIQADATMDVVCANGQRIQQAWEDNIEDSED